jgi:hypothetical protein
VTGNGKELLSPTTSRVLVLAAAVFSIVSFLTE